MLSSQLREFPAFRRVVCKFEVGKILGEQCHLAYKMLNKLMHVASGGFNSFVAWILNTSINWRAAPVTPHVKS